PSRGEEDLALYEPEPSPAAAALVYGFASDQQNASRFSTLASSLSITVLVRFLFAIWLAGAILWFAVAGMRIYRFQRLLRYGTAAPRALQDEAFVLAQRLGLARCPAVWLIPGRVSPLLWALGRRARL